MKQDIRIDFSPEAVLIGNGDFPTHSLPLQLLNASPFTVCCDGAANHYLDSGRIPDRIVGDGDSLREEYKRKYASILHLNPDQEHTLGNISLLIEYHRLGIEARIYTDYGVFIPASGTNRFQAQPGSQVSIFSFGTQSMRSEGLRYPLRDFTNWWQGTLNEVASSPFTIECEGDYLVFLKYPS